jgi:hypothetical protein
MPSYIELDKQGSFPSAPNSSKVIAGANASGQLVTVDENGAVTPVGGGTGLNIPKPIVYSTKNNNNHYFNEPISNLGDGSGLPGAIAESVWSTDILKLTYQTSDLSFLDYNPKYFLFVHYGSAKMANATDMHPNTRVNNSKFGRYFVHPPSYTGSYVDDEGWLPNFTSSATYTNFSNISAPLEYFGQGATPKYTSSFTAFTTEWSVATGSGQQTILTDFDPLRFYWFRNDVDLYEYRGKSFFPFRTDFATGSDSGYKISTTTKKAYKKWAIEGSQTANGVTTYGKPRVNLYCKFAIVIQDPNNPSNYIIGPMSDTIKIFPRSGYFEDDVDTGLTYKYYYNWTWQVV